MPREQLVGTVTKYDNNNGLAYVNLTDMLAVGEQIHIKGPRDDFTQQVDDLQVAHHEVHVAYKGDLAEIKTVMPVDPQDQVYGEI